MGLLDGMLTLITTISKVAGALSGIASDGKGLDLGPRGSGPYPNLGQIVFMRRGGKVQAYNQSLEDSVTLFFPGNATLSASPTQLSIPPTQWLDVSLALTKYADAGVDEFTLVPLPGIVKGLGTEPETNIQAQATQPILPGIEVSVGPYFTVKLNAQDKTILVGVVGTLTLAAIVLLNVRGAGTTVVRIANALRKTGLTYSDDDAQHITVDLPAGFDVSGGLTEVDVSASVGGLAGRIGEENTHLLSE